MTIRAFSIGSLKVPINVLHAPLAGCTDFPFRSVASQFAPGVQFCEMVKMEALIRRDEETLKSLQYNSKMFPIGAQLCGSNPKIAARAARMIEDMGFDLIDLNCGCPVDKVVKDGSGSGLLKTPLLIGEILSEIVSAVRIPVTVKIRAGWDETKLVHTDIVRIAELVGVSALTIHGRTRQQGYSGKAHREWIRQAKEAATYLPVIGNGDIFCAQDALSMIEQTGCDGVLLARGVLANPWLVDDIRQLFVTGKVPERSYEDRRRLLLEHFFEIVSFFQDEKVFTDIRRVGHWYLGRSKETREFRAKLCSVSTISELEALLISRS